MARRVTGVFVVWAGTLLACIAGGAGPLWAQGTVLNHEGLSFLEEPLAIGAGDVSFVLMDTDGGFDVGATHQRPHGNKDYRLSVRYTEGAFTSAGGAARFDSRALGGVGEVIYGSTLFDAGAGFETLSSPGLRLERWYVSSGVRVKTGVVSLSLEGHYGRVEGEEEASAALGVRYDLARGLSANFGLHHEDARVNVNGVNLINSKGTRAVVSLRFSF